MHSLDIVGIGAYTPLGLNALQLAMCMRAQLFEPQTSTLIDRRGRSVGMCMVGGHDVAEPLERRLRRLATPALRQLAAQHDVAGWPLLVALAEPERPAMEGCEGWPLGWGATAGVALDDARSATFRHGHAGFAYALHRAVQLLDEGAPGVVVGGVDSYADADVVRWLDAAHRLHALDVMDGMVPGEAAAFVALRRTPQRADQQALARITQVSVAEETGIAHPPNAGAAMTQLVAEADAGAINWVLNDINGEHHRVQEWLLVGFRSELGAAEECRVPGMLGDIGAASGAVMAVLAAQQWRSGCARADHVLALMHAEGAERGIVVLKDATAEQNQQGDAFPASQQRPRLFPPRTAVKPFLPTQAGDEPPAATPFDVSQLLRETHALLARGGDADGAALARIVDAGSADAKAATEPARPLVQLRHRNAADDNAQPVLRRLVRTCLDGIGVTGQLRNIRGDDRWGSAVHHADERLLAYLDALLALGEPRPGCEARVDVPAEVMRHAAEAFVADPYRAFAQTLVLGSLDSEEALQLALAALRDDAESTHPARTQALALAPHPGIEHALRRWCAEEEPALLCVALTVLCARRAREVPEALPLLGHVDELVRAAAARCIGAGAQPALALPLLEAAWRVETDERVLTALAEALLRAAPQAALALLRVRLRADLQRLDVLRPQSRQALLQLLALGGDEQDAALLAETLRRWPETAPAAGWHGAGALVDALIEVLPAAADSGAGVPVIHALRRITGAPLHQQEPVADPYDSVVDVPAWQRWWAQERTRFSPGRRYRWGAIHNAQAVAEELGRHDVPGEVRHTLALELSLVPDMPWLCTTDWVAVQRTRLAALHVRSP